MINKKRGKHVATKSPAYISALATIHKSNVTNAIGASVVAAALLASVANTPISYAFAEEGGFSFTEPNKVEKIIKASESNSSTTKVMNAKHYNGSFTKAAVEDIANEATEPEFAEEVVSASTASLLDTSERALSFAAVEAANDKTTEADNLEASDVSTDDTTVVGDTTVESAGETLGNVATIDGTLALESTTLSDTEFLPKHSAAYIKANAADDMISTSEALSYVLGNTSVVLEENALLAAEQEKAQAVIDIAESKLGCAYVSGGVGPQVFDCSGLTKFCFQQALGIELPRTAAAQSGVGESVAFSDLLPGDLLFWGRGGGVYHVAIYIGDNSYIHAAGTGKGVKVSTMDYFTPSFAKRVIQ